MRRKRSKTISKEDYLETAKRISIFLFHNQVIAEDQEIQLFKNFDDDYKNIPKKVISIGEFTTKLIRKDDEEYTYHIFVLDNKTIRVSLNKNFKDSIGPIKLGQYFRTNFNEGIFIEKKKSKKRAAILDRLLGKWKKFLMYSEIEHNFFDLLKKFLLIIYHELRSFEIAPLFSLIENNASNARLEEYGGITWKFEELSDNKIKLFSYDKGGIFDYYLNTEGLRYPPQVPGDYYADAYAAYCFLTLYNLTKKEEYLNAGISALEFVRRTYGNYEPSNIIWYHSDFKNPAYIEAVGELLPGRYRGKFLALMDKLKEDTYSPTNVFCLRYHWYNAKKYFSFDKCYKNERVIERYKKLIKKEQTKEGLIHDNNKGYYTDAHDLTYHQYSTACLGLGLKYSNDHEVKEVFLKGCNFSLSLLTPDGEVSYVGRGANNIYHLASAILSFEIASNYLKKTEMRKAGQYKRGAHLAFKYLKKWQLKNGMFPTAMNNYYKERIGWNHCETPYNALVAYFLFHSYQLADDSILENKIPSEKENYSQVMNDSGYGMVTRGNYYLTIFSGCGGSYPLYNATHRTGVGGMAILGITGKGTLIPILDHSLKKNLLVSDMPYFEIKKRKFYPYGRGELSLIKIEKNPIVKHSHIYGNFIVDRYYICFSGLILLYTIYKSLKKQKVTIKNLFSIVTISNGWSIEKEDHGLLVKNKDYYGFSFTPIYSSLRYEPKLDINKTTNPRGVCSSITLGELNHLNIKRNEKIISCSLLRPFKNERKIRRDRELDIKIRKMFKKEVDIKSLVRGLENTTR
jgi:hypothetical protein